MSELLLNPTAQRLAWAVVHFLWQGALLGLLAWGSLRLVRQRSPQVRYATACAFLAGCAVLPAVTFFYQNALPASPVEGSAMFSLLMGFRKALNPWLPSILLLWGTGTAAFALRAIGSWWWMHRLRIMATEVADSSVIATLRRTQASVGISRVVRILESARIRSPFTSGVFRPVILVPLQFFASISPLAAEAVLAHELAHIRRFDVLVIGLQTVIETLLFFHPVTWWLSRRVATEREHCCDDTAVHVCGDAVLLAQTLHRLDELSEALPALAPAAGGGDLMERIKRLLNVDQGPVRISTPVLSILVALAATTLLAREQPIQHLLRSLPSRIAATGTGAREFFQRGQREVQGTLAAIEQPSGRPLEPSQVSVSTGMALPVEEALTGIATLPQVPEAIQAPGQATVSLVPPQEAQVIGAGRLGIPWTNVLGTQIDAWPEGASFLEAAALPLHSREMDELFGRADAPGAYSYTSWPMTSSYSWRLVRLEVPAHAQAQFRVTGTSNTRRDGMFHVSLALLRTLVPTQNTWKPDPPAQSLAFTNLLDEPQSVVLLVAGPTDTPYRCEVDFSSEAGMESKSPAIPLEIWPQDKTFVKASATEVSGTSQRHFLNHLSLSWSRGSIIRQNLSGSTWPSPGEMTARLTQKPLTYLRCLHLEIKAGEHLRFRSGWGSSVQMEATTPISEVDLGWRQAIQQANAPSAEQRTWELSVHNPTQKVQSFVLVLYQATPFPRPYHIELERLAKP